MLRNSKGISLITLIVTIVVMIILISIVVNSSIDSVEETNLTKINTEIRNIKDAVSTRISNNERNETLYPIIGEKVGDSVFDYVRTIETLTSDEIDDLINKLSDRYNEGNQDYFRLVGKAEAELLGVEGLDSEHYYIVNYYECEVYGPVSVK